MASAPKRYDVHTRRTFVPRTSVEENEITRVVIDAVMPYFPLSCYVIGGWVDDGKQFWKINFHWEYLLGFLNKALDSELGEDHAKATRAIKAVLESNPPSPRTGYTASKVMGQPVDGSSRDTITKRWTTLRQCKKDFKRVIEKAALTAGLEDAKRKQWDLAVAPVARPGTSKHGEGWALDIYGDNEAIKAITKALGGWALDEASHVHCEFAKWRDLRGVGTLSHPEPAGPRPPDDTEPGICLASPQETAAIRGETERAAWSGVFGDPIRFAEVLRDVVARLGSRPVL